MGAFAYYRSSMCANTFGFSKTSGLKSRNGRVSDALHTSRFISGDESLDICHKVVILEKLCVATILRVGSNCAEYFERFAFAEEVFGALAHAN